MKLFLAFVIVLVSQTGFAQQNQKLANGKWAFYGEDFYLSLAKKKIERVTFTKVFNENHTSTTGKMDKISTQCDVGGKCYRHTVVGYDRARKIMFGELDTLKDAKGTYVLDVYCGQKFYFNNLDEVSNMHSFVNIEHTWPQSRFNGNYPKEQQKSDLHHLYLTDSQANSVRGNSPFGLVKIGEDRSGGEGCRNSSFGFTGNSGVYTPPASHRGNVARALFYFSMHYNLPIDPVQEKILRSWHKDDPVDAKDIARHEAIAEHQKIRNPFVDHPEIVDMVSDF